MAPAGGRRVLGRRCPFYPWHAVAGGFLFGMAVTSLPLSRRTIEPRDDARMVATPAS